ncbi:MAG TPA: HAMP domain-containing sensor histidine kinase [Acidimicrobiales bacterium]|nr:HAMP domain-containing sensor histidine kinase [Acidimicrobiales bacterium]
MTLRLRLLLVLVGIVAVGLVVADVVTYTSLRSYLFSQVDQQLQTASTPVARTLWTCWNQQSASPFSGPQSGVNCTLRINESGQIPSGTVGQLREPGGTVLISECFLPTSSATPNLPASPPVSQSISSATVFPVSGTGCETSAYSGIAVDTNLGTAAGPVSVVVAIPIAGVNQTLDRLELVELLVTLAVLAGLGALAWWIVRRGLRPLDEMTATAGAIAAGDLSRRVADVDPNTEVGQLGAALNKMLSEIEQAFGARAASEERLRRFLADASHELRTPLTSIRGYAEMFERGARDRPEDLATSMRHIRDDAGRMSVLVDDLLLLARLDRQRPLARVDVDLAEITASAVEAARRLAPDRSISLDSASPAILPGDADRLRQVVDNLLGNAIRHTPEGTPIDVRLRVQPEAVGLEVTDHGPGIPSEDRQKIFEPFHRADPSRARTSGGVGLGLAIVSAIARAHGGNVGVISNGAGGSGAAGGATFWVQLPRRLPEPASASTKDEGLQPPADGRDETSPVVARW